MPSKEFVMRGKTASDGYHTINFSGFKGDYAFRLIEFSIYPSENIGGVNVELAASVTAAKVFEDPANPNFDHEGLIAVAQYHVNPSVTAHLTPASLSVVNDTFLITQDLILAAVDTVVGGTPQATNWQCKFKPVKMSSTEIANANYRQFSIFDD